LVPTYRRLSKLLSSTGYGIANRPCGRQGSSTCELLTGGGRRRADAAAQIEKYGAVIKSP